MDPAASPGDAALFPADAPLVLPPAQQAALRAAYAVPVRAYHHIGHVAEVLRHWAWAATHTPWQAPRETWLAVLYHDAVYVPGRSDNEAASAALLAAHFARWPPTEPVDVAFAQALILATARHGSLKPADLDGLAYPDDARRFLDCDMAILGAPPGQFAAYDRGIAEEYRAVPRWIYRRKRRAFFRKLLGRERIYLSDLFHAHFDAPARANLAAAIAGGVA